MLVGGLWSTLVARSRRCVSCKQTVKGGSTRPSDGSNRAYSRQDHEDKLGAADLKAQKPRNPVFGMLSD